MDLTTSTSHHLGLAVAAGYLITAIYGIVTPAHYAKSFFFPTSYLASSTRVDDAKNAKTPINGQVSSETTKAVTTLMRLLCVRDLSTSAAMFALAYREQWSTLGLVILATTGLIVADGWVTWREKGIVM